LTYHHYIMPHNLSYYKNFKMINLTHTISILNSIFIIVFYAMRWIKLDITCIFFEKFIYQHNLLYVCIYLYSQQNKSYGTHELGREPNFFVRPSLAQWVASEIFISFYVFNFGVSLCTFDLRLFWAKKTNYHFIILNFVIESCSTARGYQLVYLKANSNSNMQK
jgi:hypothetical protein